MREIRSKGGRWGVLLIVTPPILFEHDGVGLQLGLLLGALGAGALSAALRVDGEGGLKHGEEQGQ